MDEEVRKIPRQPPKWLCHKLECFSDYVKKYTEKNSGRYYLELFAGSGTYSCNKINRTIDGSGLSAVKNNFSGCIYIVNDPDEAALLEQNTMEYRSRCHIINGNSINESVMQQAFDLVPRSASVFALVDPPGYTKLRWTTIKKLASHGLDWGGHKMDLLIIFPLEMALLRNLTRLDCETSIDRLYGNPEWQTIRRDLTDNKIDHAKAGKDLVNLFNKGLKELGYRHVEDLQPARFSNPPNYHIIWASDTASQKTELDSIWNKPRFLPCELFGESVIK